MQYLRINAQMKQASNLDPTSPPYGIRLQASL